MPRHLGRRALLGGALALGAAHVGCTGRSAPPRPARWAANRSLTGAGEPVVVVGAGLAGLVAARALERAGIATRVVEAAAQPGGRIRTQRGTFAGDQYAELGAELMLADHAQVQALADELRVELGPVGQGREGLRDTFEHAGKLIGDADLLAAFAPAREALARDAAACEGALIPHEAGGRFAELDATSVRDWLRQAGCRSPARELLEAYFTSALGLEPDVAAAPAMIVRLAAAGPGLPRLQPDGARRVRGGSSRLVEALATALPRIEPGRALVAAKRRADGRLVLTFDEGEPVTCADAIFALPFSVLRAVELDATLELDPFQQRAIAELAYGTGARMAVETIDRPWVAGGRSGAVWTTRGIQTARDAGGAPRSLGGLLTVECGGERGARLDRTAPKDVLAELDAIFPGVQASSTGRSAIAHWPSEPTLRGSRACYAVGQGAAFGGAEGRAAKNLHFAGEHTSRAWPGTMEGAVESGLRAAAEVVASRGES